MQHNHNNDPNLDLVVQECTAPGTNGKVLEEVSNRGKVVEATRLRPLTRFST